MRLAAFLFLAMVLVQTVSAQGTHAAGGTINGVVTDTDGKALSDAFVQITSDATKATFSTKTGSDGHYTFTGVPPGTYTLASTMRGMRPFQRKDLAVTAGQTVQAAIRIRDFDEGQALGQDRAFFAEEFDPVGVPVGPAPRMPDGRPDLSGVWRPAPNGPRKNSEPLPWAAAVIKQRTENFGKDHPGTHCLPNGMGSTNVQPYKLVQTPSLLVILFDTGDLPRQVFLDGRGHPQDPNPTWAGHSIGKWDGDVLVVDTVGFNDKGWLFGNDPHTERLHVTERFRRLDAGHLEIETTVDDPGTYLKPWTMKKVSPLAPKGEEVEESICNENNKDVQHLVGK